MKTTPHLPSRRTLSHRAARGITLVESAITLCVVAVLVSAVAPSFTQARERRHLEGVAAQVATDVHHARSLAVARHASVRISFSNAGNASCYVLHTGSAGACGCAADGGAVCQAAAQALHVVRLPQDVAVRLTSNSSSMVFDGVRGTVSPTATIRVQGRSAAIHEIVNVMGRVRACSPGGLVPGYAAC